MFNKHKKKVDDDFDKDQELIKVLNGHLSLIERQQKMLHILMNNVTDISQIVLGQQEAINNLEKQVRLLKDFSKKES